MATSEPLCCASRRHRPDATARPASLGADDRAVSEVVGYIITFGIISSILLLSMVAFVNVQEQVSERLVEQRAASAAQRVAGLAVQASIFAETYGDETRFTAVLHLQQQFEGRSYTVSLIPAGGGGVDRVLVEVPSVGVQATAVLFSAGAPQGFDVCDVGPTPGGTLLVRFDEDPAGSGSHCLFLEGT